MPRRRAGSEHQEAGFQSPDRRIDRVHRVREVVHGLSATADPSGDSWAFGFAAGNWEGRGSSASSRLSPRRELSSGLRGGGSEGQTMTATASWLRKHTTKARCHEGTRVPGSVLTARGERLGLGPGARPTQGIPPGEG
jgi:hypothetical protein